MDAILIEKFWAGLDVGVIMFIFQCFASTESCEYFKETKIAISIANIHIVIYEPSLMRTIHILYANTKAKNL